MVTFARKVLLNLINAFWQTMHLLFRLLNVVQFRGF